MWALWGLGVKEGDPGIPGRWGVFPKGFFPHQDPLFALWHLPATTGVAAGKSTGMDRDGTAGKVSTEDIFTPKSWTPLKQNPTAFPEREKQDDGVENWAQWGKHSLSGSMGKDLSI